MRGTRKYHKYINQQDLFGNTALHYASIGGFDECVKYLIDKGTDYEIENAEGWRARELL